MLTLFSGANQDSLALGARLEEGKVCMTAVPGMMLEQCMSSTVPVLPGRGCDALVDVGANTERPNGLTAKDTR